MNGLFQALQSRLFCLAQLMPGRYRPLEAHMALPRSLQRQPHLAEVRGIPPGGHRPSVYDHGLCGLVFGLATIYYGKNHCLS